MTSAFGGQRSDPAELRVQRTSYNPPQVPSQCAFARGPFPALTLKARSFCLLPCPFGTTAMTAAPSKHRIDWVDYAKGLCIILVVMMHTTLGIEKAAGVPTWLHGFIEWARPFRMPDFFLISGLFLASRIARPWRTYLDSKVLHFAYFYILWMSLQFLTKGFGIYQNDGLSGLARQYALGFIEPFGTLWFIYLLAVFFVVAKLLKDQNAWAVFLFAAVLEAAHLQSGWVVIDEFAARFVYFFAGYKAAALVFNYASRVSANSIVQIFAGLLVWGTANGLLVHLGYSVLPALSLVMGLIGAGAVVSLGVLLSKTGIAGFIRYCGENSIVIYLSFFLFMAGTRSFLMRYLPTMDLGVMALSTTAIGVVGPLALFHATRRTALSFLFKRPSWVTLENKAADWHKAPHVPNAIRQSFPQAR